MTNSVISCLSKLAKEEEAFDNLYRFGMDLFKALRESLNVAIEKGKAMDEEDRLAYHASFVDDCESLLEKLNASISKTKEDIDNEIRAIRERESDALLDAAEENDLPKTKAIILRGFADVNWAEPEMQQTPLLIASFDGHLDIVKFLVQEAKVKVDYQDNEGFSALILASQNGHLEIVRFLVKKSNAKVDSSSNEGSTGLILASQNGHLEIVKFLVNECKANVESSSNEGSTALLLASQNGHLGIVRLLVNEGKAKIDSSDNYGCNALILASKKGHLDIVKFLVDECKANVHSSSNEGFSALILASKNGHLQIVKFLVKECKANVDSSSNEGSTALILASQNGHLGIVRLLVNEGKAKIDSSDNTGCNALILASQNGHLEIVRFLVKRGLEKIDQQTKKGNTALLLACCRGHQEISLFLLSEGAAYTYKNKKGKKARDYALREGWNWNAMIAQANLSFFDHVFDCMINADYYSPLVEKGRKRKRGEEGEKKKEELPFLLRFMKKIVNSDFMMSKNIFPKLSFNPGAEAGEGMQYFE